MPVWKVSLTSYWALLDSCETHNTPEWSYSQFVNLAMTLLRYQTLDVDSIYCAGVAHMASYQAHGLDADNVKVSDWSNASYETIIHGDPKAPNFFFQASESGTDEPRVGVIDMQWCGRGLCAVDVAYCIAASADESVFDSPSSDVAPYSILQSYLDDYHGHFIAALVQHGVSADLQTAMSVLPRDVFQAHFDWAWIDLARVVIGDHWGTIDQSVFESRAGKMSMNAYNKSLPVARHFVSITDACLNQRQASDTVHWHINTAVSEVAPLQSSFSTHR